MVLASLIHSFGIRHLWQPRTFAISTGLASMLRLNFWHRTSRLCGKIEICNSLHARPVLYLINNLFSLNVLYIK